jgi:transposase InsO family protein
MESRVTVVRRYCQQGWPAARIAEAMEIFRPTVAKWVNRYRAEGMAGLEDRPARPRRRPARLSPARKAASLARRRAGHEGPHGIGWALGESPSTVHAVLARHGESRLADRDRTAAKAVRHERDAPGELVCVDVKRQGRIPDGCGWAAHGRGPGTPKGNGRLGYDCLHIAVDDPSRVAYAEAQPDEADATAEAFIIRAIAWFAERGIPVQRVVTENGSCCRSRAFRDALADARVAHKTTRACRPRTNAKVERFNLTLKREWAYACSYASNQARLDQLSPWLHRYNHHRGHTAHKGGPPMSAVNNVPEKHT